MMKRPMKVNCDFLVCPSSSPSFNSLFTWRTLRSSSCVITFRITVSDDSSPPWVVMVWWITPRKALTRFEDSVKPSKISLRRATSLWDADSGCSIQSALRVELLLSSDIEALTACCKSLALNSKEGSPNDAASVSSFTNCRWSSKCMRPLRSCCASRWTVSSNSSGPVCVGSSSDFAASTEAMKSPKNLTNGFSVRLAMVCSACSSSSMRKFANKSCTCSA
mmetsp:Transcript_62425/g.149007  ORF Transcript_62425/g.149007 Transcript_62425/m.149007 type:complete len:221 (+) Transcript_62425:72-734(+)